MTPTQRRVYHFIRGVIESNGESPTIAEIGKHVNLSSPGSVHRILCHLEKANLIARTPNIARGIRLITEGANDKCQRAEINLISGSVG